MVSHLIFNDLCVEWFEGEKKNTWTAWALLHIVPIPEKGFEKIVAWSISTESLIQVGEGAFFLCIKHTKIQDTKKGGFLKQCIAA